MLLFFTINITFFFEISAIKLGSDEDLARENALILKNFFYNKH